MRQDKHFSEVFPYVETQMRALTSRLSSLEVHKRAIEKQLASIVAQIREQGVVLVPRNVFLLLEMRGSGGVSEQLEQIAHIVGEQGYWKPRARVQNYHRQEVYHLGESAQRLFDDCVSLGQRVKQLHARLGHIEQHRQMESEMTPQRAVANYATATDITLVHQEVDAIVELLEQVTRPGWFRRLFVHGGRKKNRRAEH